MVVERKKTTSVVPEFNRRMHFANYIFSFVNEKELDCVLISDSFYQEKPNWWNFIEKKKKKKNSQK